MRTIALLCSFLLGFQASWAAQLEWVAVSEDGKGFRLAESGRPFVPWGFNYDHDDGGRLIEDYWFEQWPTVEADFREMKELGANVVRVHLQFGKFMERPSQARESSLDHLARLIELVEQLDLYLNITGLGCYHRADVPAWYDELNEEERWQAQAVFWQEVAERCCESPAIFCYDLMNEPVVAGGNQPRDDWLGPAFGDKHFVQFITLDRAGRERPEIARQWIDKLISAIRQYDQRHMVTVGLVPWSLDRPGLTSGFVPDRIADQLDFLSVHLYPERGKIDASVETLKEFAAVGKPVVIEEMFPLKCDASELEEFIEQSRSYAAGWIGFYWGRTPDELRPPQSIPEAITLAWLELFQSKTPEMLENFNKRLAPSRHIACEGNYPNHLQGICVDKTAIYWSFTTRLVKTDFDGKILRQLPVVNHHGDLCHYDGRLYVAVNLGKFNDPSGNADSWIYVYDCETLDELSRHEVQEVVYGAGGVGFRDGHFFVVGGLPGGKQENYVYEFDPQFKYLQRHVIPSGHTFLGIQTATFAHDRWWLGCYGTPKILLVTDSNFRMLGRYEFDCSLGIEGLPDGRLLAGRGLCDKDEGCTGSAHQVVPDTQAGLRALDPTETKRQ